MLSRKVTYKNIFQYIHYIILFIYYIKVIYYIKDSAVMFYKDYL